MADRFEMAEPEAETPVPDVRRRSRWRRIGVPALAVALVALGGVWLTRERIADNVIASQLESLGLPATYDVASIGARTQVLRNVVIGDPKRPDLTVEQAEVRIDYHLGLPTVAEIRLTKPRLYGSYLAGKLSFGALDKVLFAPPATKEPFRLPDLDLALDDGRALLLTDYGKLAFKADGKGGLRDGFAGTLAATAPQLSQAGCAGQGTSAFGKLTIAGERARFAGPLRLASLRCADGISAEKATVELDVRGDKDFAGLEGDAKLRGQALDAGGAHAESLGLDARLAFRGGVLTGRVAADAGGVRTDGVTMGLLGLEGVVRARQGFAKAEFRGTIDGRGLRQGKALDGALASAQAGAEGSFLAPMLAQLRDALRREERGSRLAGDIAFRRNGRDMAVVVPQARLRGGSGQTLLSLSRFQLASNGSGAPRLAGNFATGGAGLPRMTGRMEQGTAGRARFRFTMAPYRAGGGVLAVPQMVVAQVADGSLGFVGAAQISGVIPGGSVQNLNLPVEGGYSSRGDLSLWRSCVTASFDGLALGDLALDRKALLLCPSGDRAIVESGAGGVRIAAGTSSLALTGKLGDTPLRLASGPVGFAWPGTLTAKAVDVALGPEATQTRLRLNDLTAKLGRDFTGTFGGVEARLAAVPLDLANAAGGWRYADGKLVLSSVGFDVADRLAPARFEVMTAKDANLTLADNRVTAQALLREARSGREVMRVAVRHDLSSGAGHADLDVDNLAFDKGFQPDQLTHLALGVVANAAGTVRGKGEIDWTARGVTSTGRFTTDNFDLAAAFGPVKGLSGTVEFTDLLGMVTAPHQILKIVSVNPGIEVTDGVVDITLLPDRMLRLHGATWPFLGGTLTMEPTDLRLGAVEERRYTLSIVGLDAGKFIERMELGNLSATGTFDGRLPLVFDAKGGRLERGTLLSRAPGGNVSYVGTLTYKDLSPMANFAFDALKSMDYKTMTIAIEGDLEGEIVTNVRFGGVKQGAGTRKNFITRQIADLPIQFNINIRAPFYQLITSVKAMYDPAFIKDPRTLGLIDAQGRPLRRLSESLNAARPDIQHAESAKLP